MTEREIQYNDRGNDSVGHCPMCGADTTQRLACQECWEIHGQECLKYRGSSLAGREWFYDRGVELRAEGKMPPLVKARLRQAERGPIARCGTPGCVSLHQVGPMDRHIGADGMTWTAVTSSCGHHSDAEDCRCWGVWCIGTTITWWVGSDGARGAPDTWDRGNLQTARQLAAQMAWACAGATYELRQHDPGPKPLTPPPGIVATGATACRCGRPVGPGWPCLSGGCAYDERGELLRPPVSLAGTLAGPITVTPAMCPLRWCGRQVPEHTEAEVTRCAGYRGRLRAIEERLRKFLGRVETKEMHVGTMRSADIQSEREWAKDRTAEEVETLRREWSSLR